MPVVDFEIDEEGRMSIDIHGVIGPACENIEKMIAELTGRPATAEKKPSYYQHARNHEQIRGR